MKLKKYLSNNKLTQMRFIQSIEKNTGVKIPQSTIAKWITETRIPRKKEMLLIVEVTNNKVQPNDFYGIKNESN